MPSPAAPLFTLHLHTAQRAWECLPRGAEIAVLEGAVRLHLRTYLAGVWVELPVLLRAGERHRVEVAGWLQLEAVAGVAGARVSAVARQRGGLGRLVVALCSAWGPKHKASPTV